MAIRDHHALAAYLHARADLAFDWGRNDKSAAAAELGNSCVHFAAGAVQAQTGVNVMARLPRWTSEKTAKARVAALGGLEAATDQVLRRIPPAMAQRGDVAGVVQADGQLGLMVVEGKTLVGPDANRVRRLPRERMVMAWSAS